MNRKISEFKIIILLPLFIVACNHLPEQNLISNGSAEVPSHDSVPKGWQNVSGHWISAEGDSAHHDYAHAEDSSHYFFGGYGLLCLLQQDADVFTKEENEQQSGVAEVMTKIKRGQYKNTAPLKSNIL